MRCVSKLILSFFVSILLVSHAHAGKESSHFCQKVTKILAFSALVQCDARPAGQTGHGNKPTPQPTFGRAYWSEHPYFAGHVAGEGEGVSPREGRTNDKNYAGHGSLAVYKTYPFEDFPYWPKTMVVEHVSTHASNTTKIIPSSKGVLRDIAHFLDTAELTLEEEQEIEGIVAEGSITDSCEKILLIQDALENRTMYQKAWEKLLNTTVAALNIPTCNSDSFQISPITAVTIFLVTSMMAAL